MRARIRDFELTQQHPLYILNLGYMGHDLKRSLDENLAKVGVTCKDKPFQIGVKGITLKKRVEVGHFNSHSGLFDQNKILFGRMGKCWLPGWPEFSSSIFNALFNQIKRFIE